MSCLVSTEVGELESSRLGGKHSLCTARALQGYPATGSGKFRDSVSASSATVGEHYCFL